VQYLYRKEAVILQAYLPNSGGKGRGRKGSCRKEQWVSLGKTNGFLGGQVRDNVCLHKHEWSSCCQDHETPTEEICGSLVSQNLLLLIR
jgi:hypothetical protein